MYLILGRCVFKPQGFVLKCAALPNTGCEIILLGMSDIKTFMKLLYYTCKTTPPFIFIPDAIYSYIQLKISHIVALFFQLL